MSEAQQIAAHWWLTKDGDRRCLELYNRHYSAYRYRDGRKRSQFVGPGETVVLRTYDGDALFVWRRFIDDSRQRGVNCAVFRNESQIRSSVLIRQADAILGIVGHDVEQFVDVVARYGAVASGVDGMVRAANKGLSIGQAQIDAACGTCKARIAA